MFINKIDTIIDSVLDDFGVYLQKNKLFKSIKTEYNFVKYQKEINDILINYISHFPVKNIENIIKREESSKIIINYLKKYITIYLFLLIGHSYSAKQESYINNIIEFSKNQGFYNYKVNNLFTSKSNSLIIKLYNIIKNIQYIISNEIKIEASSSDILNKHLFGVETFDFLKKIGDNFIYKFLINEHNIVKLIIVIFIYNLYEKKELTNIIELIELSDEEYIFIDIIESLTQIIDISILENVLISVKKNKYDLIYSIWNYLINPTKKITLTIDEKIIAMFNKGLIIPIVDDFLMYHKNSENYDKTKEIKKKDETRLKYIVSKLDKVADMYSKKHKNNNENAFAVALENRKLVIINDIEDIKIINKLLNQVKLSNENTDITNDFLTYKSYAYNNFRDFKSNGFSILLNKTLQVCRQSNFEFTKDTLVEFRTGSKDMTINIVGLLVAHNIYKCLHSKEIINVNEINTLKKKLSDIIINRNKIINKFTFDAPALKQNDELTINESIEIKNIIASLYIDYLDICYQKIISILPNNSHIDILYNYVDVFAKKYMPVYNEQIIISDKSYLFDKYEYNDIFYLIESYILTNKIIIDNETADTNDNKLYGMYGDIIKLPTYKHDKNTRETKIAIKLTDNINNNSIINKYGTGGICQHFITWNNIMTLKKTNQLKYSIGVFNFNKQFVIETPEQELICKSCNLSLDIKKFITGGSFDNDSKKFIAHSILLDISLEDSVEYGKYKQTIKIMDKLIDKIATIINIPHLTGSFTANKMKRKMIIKNTIDILLLNNKMLKERYKERNEVSAKKYNISFSNLFIFELDNNILQFSSKDKDQYRSIKFNNILIYIIIFIILDMTDLQIKYISTDQKYLCDYENFIKIKEILFGNIKIKKNDKDDVLYVKDYNILMYILYIFSCKLIRYQLWQHEYAQTYKTKLKQIPSLQMAFIYTFIDIVNSMLENSYVKNASYIFEMFRYKFYDKLNKLLIINLQSDKYKEQSNLINKNKLEIIKNEQLNGNFTELKFDKFIIEYNSIRSSTLNISTKKHNYNKIYYELSNLTNCDDGLFHLYSINNKSLICNLCNVNCSTVQYNKETSKKINKKFINLIEESNLKVACKLKYFCKETYIKFKQQESENMYNKYLEIETKIQNENSYIVKLYNKLGKKIKNHSDFNNYVDSFIKKINDSIDQNILGNNQLSKNYYIIDHDYSGVKNDKKIILDYDSVKFKENNQHYNVDVLCYIVHSPVKITVYYNAITKQLLGYKEENKNYSTPVNYNNYLQVEYSLLDKIKLLGFTSVFIETDVNIKKLLDERLVNMKSILYYLVIILNKIFNGSTIKVDDINDEKYYYENNLLNLVDKYYKKLNSINIYDSKNKHMAFKHWKGIYRHNSNILINETNRIHINVYDIIEYDMRSIYCIYYIISEFEKLLEYNKGHLKINIIEFLTEFIDVAFNLYNKEKLNYNYEIKRFKYVLQGSEYLRDIIEKTKINKIGIYDEDEDEDELTSEEKKKIKNNNMEENEMKDALDIALDRDENDNYDEDDDVVDIEKAFD